MEARGVEPLSEGKWHSQASLGEVTVLMSPEELPVTGFPSGQPDCLLLSTPRRRLASVSHFRLGPHPGTWAILSESTHHSFLGCESVVVLLFAI